MRKCKLLLMTLSVLLVSNFATASLIGDSVNFKREFNAFVGADETFIVTNDVELPLLEGCYGVDVGATYLRIDPLCPGMYGSGDHDMTFSDLDISFLGVTFSSVGISGVDANNVTFGVSWVNLDIADMLVAENSFIQLDLITQRVSAPSLFVLFSLAVAGLVIRLHKKRT